MVVSALQNVPGAALRPSLLRDRLLVRFTWKDAQAMVQAGLLPEDASIELLDGQFVRVDRSTTGQEADLIGRPHVVATQNLARLAQRIDGPPAHVESQQPLRLNEDYATMPDFMIVRGSLTDYTDAPSAADVSCVVEVADTSYDIDSGVKLRAYARARVPQYVIFDLRHAQAEVYEQPDPDQQEYVRRTSLSRDQALALRLPDGGSLEVPLREVLPGAG